MSAAGEKNTFKPQRPMSLVNEVQRQAAFRDGCSRCSDPIKMREEISGVGGRSVSKVTPTLSGVLF